MGNYRFIEVKSWGKKNNVGLWFSGHLKYLCMKASQVELTGSVSRYLFKTSVIASCLLKRWPSFHQSSL